MNWAHHISENNLWKQTNARKHTDIIITKIRKIQTKYSERRRQGEKTEE